MIHTNITIGEVKDATVVQFVSGDVGVLCATEKGVGLMALANVGTGELGRPLDPQTLIQTAQVRLYFHGTANLDVVIDGLKLIRQNMTTDKQDTPNPTRS